MMLVPRLLNILLCPGCDAVMSLLLLPLNVNSVTTPLRCDQPLTQSDSVGSNIHILILEQKWYVSNIILGNKKISNFLSKSPILTSFFLFLSLCCNSGWLSVLLQTRLSAWLSLWHCKGKHDLMDKRQRSQHQHRGIAVSGIMWLLSNHLLRHGICGNHKRQAPDTRHKTHPGAWKTESQIKAWSSCDLRQANSATAVPASLSCDNWELTSIWERIWKDNYGSDDRRLKILRQGRGWRQWYNDHDTRHHQAQPNAGLETGYLGLFWEGAITRENNS